MAALYLTVARLDTTRRTALAVVLAVVALALLSAAVVTSALLLAGGDPDAVGRGLLWVGDIRWRR